MFHVCLYILSCLFLVASWSAQLLCMMFPCVYVTFLYRISGQVRYLIVSISVFTSSLRMFNFVDWACAFGDCAFCFKGLKYNTLQGLNTDTFTKTTNQKLVRVESQPVGNSLLCTYIFEKLFPIQGVINTSVTSPPARYLGKTQQANN